MEFKTRDVNFSFVLKPLESWCFPESFRGYLSSQSAPTKASWRHFVSAENLLLAFNPLSSFLAVQKFTHCSSSSFSVIDEAPGTDLWTLRPRAQDSND